MNINLKKINYELIKKLIVFVNLFIFLYLWDLNFNFDPFLFIIFLVF